jgi:hypothetical protein
VNAPTSVNQPVTVPRAVPKSDVRLHGRQLVVARLTWVLAALAILGLDALGTPILFRVMHTGCDGDTCLNLQPSTATMASLLAGGLSRTFFAIYVTALYWTGTLVYAAIAAAIFWRRSDDRMALFGSFALLVFGAGPVFGAMKALPTSNPIWAQPVSVVSLVGTVAFYVFFCIFPSGHFVPRWMRWAALVWAIGPLLTLIPYAPLQASIAANTAFVVLFGLLVFAQAYRYWRISSPAQRQQTKWVVLGFVSGLGGFLAFLTLDNLVVSASWASSAPGVLFSDAALSVPLWLIPLSIAVAILRSQLWDIDVIIRRTLIYGTLTAVLAGLYFGVVIAAQFVGERLTGQTRPPSWLVVVTTLLIAALFNPLRRRVQRVIDRRFYRSRYDAARTIEAFAATLRTELDLSALSDHLVSVVEATMRPEHISLWLPAAKTRRVPVDEALRGGQPREGDRP